MDSPGGSLVKNPPANAGADGDTCVIPGLGTSSGGGDSNPLQNSHQDNLMDRGAWWATVHRVTKLDTTEATELNCTHNIIIGLPEPFLPGHLSQVVLQLIKVLLKM